MQVGLFGDLGAQRIDHDQLAALALRHGGQTRTRCRLATVALLPHTTFSAAFSAISGGPPGTAP